MAVKKVLERDIKKYLLQEVKKHGGIARKLSYENRKNAPDWMIVLNGMVLIELKKPGDLPSPAQQREIDEIINNGGRAGYINSLKGVDQLMYSMRPSLLPHIIFSPSTR